MPSAKVQFKGPFFEAGRRNAVMRRLDTAIREEAAQVSVDLVQALLDAVLVHPTGYYRSQIKADRATSGLTITDSDVIYGPWLEGTGSQNYPVTRFKGYHTFRRANQILPEKIHALARRHVMRAVKDLGG